MRGIKVKYNSMYFYIHQDLEIDTNPLNKGIIDNLEQMGHLL